MCTVRVLWKCFSEFQCDNEKATKQNWTAKRPTHNLSECAHFPCAERFIRTLTQTPTYINTHTHTLIGMFFGVYPVLLVYRIRGQRRYYGGGGGRDGRKASRYRPSATEQFCPWIVERAYLWIRMRLYVRVLWLWCNIEQSHTYKYTHTWKPTYTFLSNAFVCVFSVHRIRCVPLDSMCCSEYKYIGILWLFDIRYSQYSRKIMCTLIELMLVGIDGAQHIRCVCVNASMWVWVCVCCEFHAICNVRQVRQSCFLLRLNKYTGSRTLAKRKAKKRNEKKKEKELERILLGNGVKIDSSEMICLQKKNFFFAFVQ